MKRKTIPYTILSILLGACLMGCGTTTPSQETTAGSEAVIEEAPQENADTTDSELNPSESEQTEETILKPGVYQSFHQEEIEGDIIYCFDYITLLEDHTGFWEVQDRVPITWEGNTISTEYNTFNVTLENEEYVVQLEFGTEAYHLLDVDLDEYLENWEDPEYSYALEGSYFPSCFVEEAANKTSFDSFNDLISYLEKGQGYAYVELQGGYSGKLLLVTEQLYDNLDGNMVTIDACIFGENANGKVTYWSLATGQDTTYPLSIKDGVLYCGGNHTVDGYISTPDGNGIMLRVTASESYDEDGTANYWGLYREDNSFDNSTPIDSEEGFQNAMNEMLHAEVVNFTVIE